MPSSVFHNLLEACQAPGCPICRLENVSVERYLKHIFYESVNNIQTREKLRGSLGFCREHTHLATDKNLGNALGFALIYQDVITNILRGLENGSAPTLNRLSSFLKQLPEQLRTKLQNVIYALTPHKHCIVCQHRDNTLHDIVSALVDGLKETEMVEALKASDGLCIPHLKKTVESIRERESFDAVLTIHREKLESLRSDLAEFIRKNDYRYQGEGFGPEGDSWQRAVNKLTGDRMGIQE